MASVRVIARLIGKNPATVQRWKATNPELYRAVNEYADRQADNKEKAQ